MVDPPLFPPERQDEYEEEAPPDALPASPGMRRVAIAVYILIVVCVILGLLLTLVWSGIVSHRWGVPLPEPWSV